MRLANGRRDKIFGNLSGHHDAAANFKTLIFTSTLRTLIESRGKIEEGSIERLTEKKCPSCKMQRRVGGFPSLPLLFCFPSSRRPQTIYQGFRFESCGLSFRVRARPIFFTIFFFSQPFFTPRARAGFIEFIPKITPYNLPRGIARMRISRGLF